MNADPIRHVVLLMLENHSFDQMLGSLQSEYPELDGVDIESPSARFNVDQSGNKIFQAPTIEQQLERDPKHETENVLAQIANGNAGFVNDYQVNVAGTTATNRQEVMGYYPPDYLHALYQLGKNFTVCDRWFSSLPGPTWPNRFFALSGTSSGEVLMPEGLRHPRLGEFTAQDQVTLFDRLNEVGKSWKVYFYDFPISLLLNHQRRVENLACYSPIKNFFTAVQNEKHFPSFVFIEPKYMAADENDDHPPHNVFKAEKLIADVYNAIRSNDELWESTLLVVSYDEHGGFYDHVEPPAAVPPDSLRGDSNFGFDRLGVRVTAILISPWVAARVEKTLFDHTSLLKYLIDKWQLAPLGARTAAANSIGIAIRTQKRDELLPFIRIPYTQLMPGKPELEKEDISTHHDAIHAFALFLARAEGAAAEGLVAGIARGAGAWMKLKAWLGRELQQIGRWLTKSLDSHLKDKNLATTRVATEQISNAQS